MRDPSCELLPGEQGVSPVIGIALLIGIVVALGAVASFIFLGLADSEESTPDAVVELDATEDGATHELRHEGGEVILGNRTEIVGVANESALQGHRFGGGDTIEVIPVEDEVEIIWYSDDSSFIIHRFEADSIDDDVDVGCPWVDSNYSPGNQLDIDLVVACDINISDPVHVKDGGAVVGDLDAEQVDMDDGTVYGDLDSENKIDMDDTSLVHGDVQSTTGEIQLDNGAEILGSATATNNRVFVQTNSRIEGDAIADADVEVDEGSVDGAAVSRGGQVIVSSGGTIGGSVYVENGNDANVDCNSGTVSGIDCADDPPVRDESDY